LASDGASVVLLPFELIKIMSKLIIKNKYGVIPNELLNNPKISLKAKGLFAYLQSKPDEWRFSKEKIAFQTKDGKDGVKSALQELEKWGYLRRIPSKNKKGKWTGYDYILAEKPSAENPSTEKPSAEKGVAYSNKDISNKDNSKKDNTLITNGDLEKSPPKSSKKIKRKDFRVPAETYKRITDAYEKYKGIKLSGAEYGEVKRAIKTMLYSGRTEQNIIDFMRWINEIINKFNSDEKLRKKYVWLENWTILTIKRKMPEFLAGKFTIDDDDGADDIVIPEYAKGRI